MRAQSEVDAKFTDCVGFLSLLFLVWVVGMETIENFESCKLERKSEAIKLEKYISQVQRNRVGSHTININAKWGEGKIHFLKCWKSQLQANHVVIYWNAWDTDFSEDPIVSLFHVYYETIKSMKDGTLKGVILSFLKDHEVRLLEVLNDVVSVCTKVNVKERSKDYLQKKDTNLLKSYKKDVENIDSLRSMLREFSAEVERAGEIYSPIYVLIDELDRCRPTYALTLLERVKHIFNVKGFEFIIATDTDQLQHTVKAVYGSEFDAQRYLKRFFDVQYTFPEVSPDKHAEYLFDASKNNVAGSCHLPGDWCPRSVFSDFSIRFRWSMRDQVQIFEKLNCLADLYFHDTKLPLVPILLFLGLNHSLSSELYSKVVPNLTGQNYSNVLSDSGIGLGGTEQRYSTHIRRNNESRRLTKVNIGNIISSYLDKMSLTREKLQKENHTLNTYTYESDITKFFMGADFLGGDEIACTYYMNMVATMGGFNGWQGEDTLGA